MGEMEKIVSTILIIICLQSIIFLNFFSLDVEYIYSNCSSKKGYLGYDIEVSSTQDNCEFDYDTYSEDPTTRSLGGTLEWSIDLADEALSTPAICDLNPPENGNETYYEVVVASSDDKICAVDKDGELVWEFNDCVVDDMTILASGLGYEPPPFFASVLPVDIANDNGAEIILGEEDGILCLKPDGSKLWSDKGCTDGYYFYSGVVCDIEGDYRGIDQDGNDVGLKDDLEFIFFSYSERYDDAYLELWDYPIVSCKLNISGDDLFLARSVVTSELDGFLVEGDESVIQDKLVNDPDTLYTDVILITNDFQRIIISHEDGQPHYKYNISAIVPKPDEKIEYDSYGFSGVANLNGSMELECVAGFGSGSRNWTDARGGICMFGQDGVDVCTPFTTGPAPSGVYSSPAICDAQVIREKDLGPGEKIDYEVYFGCDNGRFYCLQGSDMTELWSYQTGGRILSSPAVCNINTGHTLEVVVGSDDGFVYCFEADPQELDRNGNPNPKDNGVPDGGGENGDYDLLWAFDTKSIGSSSGKIGISSPVIGDIDNDGELEVLIGDTGGTLYCISAGGYCAKGQIDWPMFHYDLNKTGFYRPKEAHGISIRLLEGLGIPEDNYKIQPGQTKTYHINVKNQATYFYENDTDTFWLEFEQDLYTFGTLEKNHNWPKPILTGEKLKWGYKEDSTKLEPYLVLKRLEEVNLTLNVTAPWSGELDEFYRINLMVQSANVSHVFDSITFSIYLDINLDFKVSILIEPNKDKDFSGKKVIEMNPSEQAFVGVQIKNTGSRNDSYHLAIEGNTYGWEIYFNETKSKLYEKVLKLDALIMEEQFPENYHGNEGLVYFTIKPPPDAGENEVLTLKLIATSVYSNVTPFVGELIKFDYLYVIINPKPKMELTCNEPRKSIAAGETAIFLVNLINYGSSDIEVKIHNSQLDYSWEIQFLFESIEYNNSNEIVVPVEKESISQIHVLLRAPKETKANTKQSVIIFGTTINHPNLITNDSIELSAIVDKYYKLNASISTSIFNADPGSIVSTYLEVTNLGNIDDVISIKTILPDPNWNTQFFLNEIETVTSELAPGEQNRFKVEISIPIGQLVGSYEIILNITSFGDTNFIKMKVNVNRIDDLSLYGISEIISNSNLNPKLSSVLQPQQGFSPGDVVDFNFQLANNGNSPSKVRLELESLFPILSEIEPPAIDWKEFDEVGWWASIYKISNYDFDPVEYKRTDFNQDIDLLNKSNRICYMDYSSLQIRSLTLHLANNQTIWIQCRLIIPEDLQSTYPKIHPFQYEPWCFRLSCESIENIELGYEKKLDDNKVIFKLDVLYPDLTIIDLSIPPKLIEDSSVLINFTIINVGNVIVKNVTIALYVDNQEIERQIIPKIMINIPKSITFNWNCTSGEHNIMLKVDPDNEINELSEKNNEKNVDVSIDKIDKDHKTGTPEFQSYSLILLFLIFLIIISFVIIKRFHRKT